MKQASGVTGYQLGLIACVMILWVVCAIDPADREIWLLENAFVAISAPTILFTARSCRLSSLSYTLIAIYLSLHLIGGYYDYDNAPFGEQLGWWFGSQRNCYDRLVHFCFGFLLAYPMRELILRSTSVRGVWGYLLPLEITLSLSAVYEILEW